MIIAASSLESNMSETTTAPYYYYIFPFNYYHFYLYSFMLNAELWVNTIVPPFSLVFGVPFNLLIVLIFGLNGCEVSRSARFYYVVIAMNDLLTLMSFSLPEYIGFMHRLDLDFPPLPVNVTILCKLSRWVWLSSWQGSSFSLTLFCIERLFVISNPLKAKSSPFSRNSMIVTVVLNFVTYSTNAYMLAYFKVYNLAVEPYVTCTTGLVMMGIINCATIIYMIVPLLIQLICNSLLIYRLIQNKRSHSKLTASKQTTRKDLMAAVVLATITAINLIVNVPSGVGSTAVSILSFVPALPLSSVANIGYFTFMMELFAFEALSANFIVYVARIPRFRQSVVRVVFCDLIKPAKS